MPFPESERAVFQKNPLAEVICQLRFPTILEIGAEEPAAFQKQIRASYPIYSKDHGLGPVPPQVVQLINQLQLPIQLGSGQASAHKFATEDDGRFVSLNTGFIAVTKRNYLEWPAFRQEVEALLHAVEAVYEPAFYERIGLRYSNVIDKEGLGLSVHWDRLLNRDLIGMLGLGELKDDIRDINGNALIALSEVKGGFVNLRYGLVTVDSGSPQSYFVDADFFTEERTGKDDVLDTLNVFRRHSGNLFRWAITPRLHKALEPRR